MEQELRPSSTRKSSEQLRRQQMYAVVNRVNTFLKFQKTSEERLKTKQAIAEHKKAMIIHYGKDYNRRKIYNPPITQYAIT